MRCTAKFTTLTPTDDVWTYHVTLPAVRECLHLLGARMAELPDGATVTRRGDRLYRDDVQCPENDGPHQCMREQAMADKGFVHPNHLCECGVVWADGWHGATPHRDPMDELVAVSEEAGLYDCPDCDGKGKRVTTRDDVHAGKVTFSQDCPSCGGSGTRFADEYEDPLVEEIERSVAEEHDRRCSGCPSCGGSGTRPADTRSVERRHVDAAVDALAAEGVPMLDRDRLARAALDAAWRKAPWEMPGTRPADPCRKPMLHVDWCDCGTRPTVNDAEVRAIGERVYGDWQHPQNPAMLNEIQWQAASDAAEAAARAREENRDA